MLEEMQRQLRQQPQLSSPSKQSEGWCVNPAGFLAVLLQSARTVRVPAMLRAFNSARGQCVAVSHLLHRYHIIVFWGLERMQVAKITKRRVTVAEMRAREADFFNAVHSVDNLVSAAKLLLAFWK